MSAPAIAALGIDAGSTTMKIVGVTGAGDLGWELLEEAEPRMEAQAVRLLERAHEEGGAAEDSPVVATGYGRKLIRRADRMVTEITCHARGVYRALGHGGTLVDIGGQDSKVIVIDEGRGQVVHFTMNDKCAAGTGRFLEVVARRLRAPLGEFAAMALSVPREVSISSTCTVFAESEMISLLARGEPVEQIARGMHHSLVRRIAAMTRSAGLRPPLMLSGGVARNPAVVQMLGEELGHPVLVPPSPQLMGAYGAALIGLEDRRAPQERGPGE